MTRMGKLEELLAIDRSGSLKDVRREFERTFHVDVGDRRIDARLARLAEDAILYGRGLSGASVKVPLWLLAALVLRSRASEGKGRGHPTYSEEAEWVFDTVFDPFEIRWRELWKNRHHLGRRMLVRTRTAARKVAAKERLKEIGDADMRLLKISGEYEEERVNSFLGIWTNWRRRRGPTD